MLHAESDVSEKKVSNLVYWVERINDYHAREVKGFLILNALKRQMTKFISATFLKQFYSSYIILKTKGQTVDLQCLQIQPLLCVMIKQYVHMFLNFILFYSEI